MPEKARIIFLLVVLSVMHLVSGDELVFVNIIFRHGDRAPLAPYPNDPYKNSSLWPSGFGQLTNIGKRQHFKLGQWFRQRYIDFLPEHYSSNHIYVQSTDFDRTLMSAESNLAGLYSPIKSDIWNSEIKWQPIPIHTVPQESDNVLSGTKKCPQYEMELRQLLENEEFRNYNLEIEPLYDYVSNHSGKNIRDLQELEWFYGTLFVEHLYKLPLPKWTNKIFPKKLLPWVHLCFKMYCYTPALQRLKVGLLLNEILERFMNKSLDRLDPNRTMWIYSGHDFTIANLLMAFGAFDEHVPPYTATIILELRRNLEIGYYVSAFYKNETQPHGILILGCDLKCPLDKLQKLLKPILITKSEWDDECQNITAPYVFASQSKEFFALRSAITVLAISSCAILLVIICANFNFNFKTSS